MPSSEALKAAERLEGFHLAIEHSDLRVYRHEDGTEVAIVVSTGRTQVRVHYSLDLEGRKKRAESVYRLLVPRHQAH